LRRDLNFGLRQPLKFRLEPGVNLVFTRSLKFRLEPGVNFGLVSGLGLVAYRNREPALKWIVRIDGRIRGSLVTENRFDRARRAIRAQRIVRLMQTFDGQALMFLPVCLTVSGRAELSVRDLPVERKLPVAEQASYVIGP
jgi:hypothetical protein